MIVLVNGATRTKQRYAHSPALGHLITPASQNRLDVLLADGLPWAADNGCFTGLDEPAFVRMLQAIRAAARQARWPLWVAVPDKVADAAGTWQLWKWYMHFVRGSDCRAAFVAQDNCTSWRIPWEKLDCIFVGGSTAWKLGPEAASLIIEAKRRGKWVHIGRVNSAKRERLFDALGADSFDGGQYSKWPDAHLPGALQRAQHRQLGMLEVLK